MLAALAVLVALTVVVLTLPLPSSTPRSVAQNEIFGVAGVDAVEKAAPAYNVLVTGSMLFDVGCPDTVLAAKLQALKDTGSTMFMLFVNQRERCRLMTVAANLSMYGRQWIAGDAANADPTAPTSGYFWLPTSSFTQCFDGSQAGIDQVAMNKMASSVLNVIANPTPRADFLAAYQARFPASLPFLFQYGCA